MKKISTLISMGAIVCLIFGSVTVNSQYADLDPGYYYLIYNRVGGNIMGIDPTNITEDQAQVMQQDYAMPMDNSMWKVVPVTEGEGTYRFINKQSGMALGVTEWRGADNPYYDESADPQVYYTYTWNGNHRSACQRDLNEEDEFQVWQPTEFPDVTTIEDSTLYRMTNSVHLEDSGLTFNVWSRITDVGICNIAVFPGAAFETDLYNDVESLYAYYFEKTSTEVITSVSSIENNPDINVYSRRGEIILKGKLEGVDVEVYSILGSKLFSKTMRSSECIIPVKTGFYIVKAGNKVEKINIE